MTNGKHEFWMTGFTASGRKVSFTLSSDDPKELVHFAVEFDAYLANAGISIHEPGLDEGEQSETFHFIVRRAKGNDDGTETPIIDLYIDHDKMRFSLLKVYLNTSDDVANFQQATGLQLGALPLYDGQAAIERGKDTRIDSKYMVRLPRPVTVIWKLNPMYEDGGKKAKRLFVRWEMDYPRQTPSETSQERRSAVLPPTPAQPQAAPPVRGQNPYGNQTAAQAASWEYTSDKEGALVDAVTRSTGHTKKEVENTVRKMFGEGAFNGVASAIDVADMVAARVMGHNQVEF